MVSKLNETGLCYQALTMSKKNQGATILDLRDINRIIKQVRSKDSKIKYRYLGNKEDLLIIGLGELSGWAGPVILDLTLR